MKQRGSITRAMADHTPEHPPPPGSYDDLKEQAVLDVFRRARKRKVFSSEMLSKRSGLHYTTGFTAALARLVKRGVLIQVTYNRYKVADG